MTGAKKHLTKKHRARPENYEDNKEDKNARSEVELQSRLNEGIIDVLGDKDDEVITASQAATITMQCVEDIMSNYKCVNVITEENNTERFEIKEDDKDEANKSSNWNQDWK